MARRSQWRGARPQFVVLDEAQPFEVPGDIQQQIRRQLGDDWDDTPAGVMLRPVPLGTIVEVWDTAYEVLVLGTVVKRTSGPATTTYRVSTTRGDLVVGRDHLTVFDRSPEGIERWLEGDRPRTSEEVERFLGNA